MIRGKLLILFFLMFCGYQNAQSDKPENIIILIGDGMGINHVGASLLKNPDSPFHKFHSLGLSITCSADKLITDSAAGATALATGQLTRNRYVGVDSTGNSLYSLFDLAEDKGISTGIIVTGTVSHATPGSFFAETKDRNDEPDIALQLTSQDVEVIIGGGLKYFLPEDSGGERTDKVNLVNEFKRKGYFIADRFDELLNVPDSETHILSLFEKDALNQSSERDFSLGDLTRIALKNLKRNSKGFVLVIEGSQIDWAAHDNKAAELLEEMRDFESAVHEALIFAESDHNTLVLVTADHETGGLAVTQGSRETGELIIIFAAKGHTASPVPVFAFGPGEEYFRKILNINEIGQILINLLNSRH